MTAGKAGGDGASGIYRSLIKARLRDHPCAACGKPLEDGTVVFAAEGTTLDEYGLSDSSAASLLAATELLTVRCVHCGTSCEVGASMVHEPEAPVLSAGDLTQWNPHAIEVYRSIVATRLRDRACSACGTSLQRAKVERAAGGATLPEFDLDDDAAVAIVGWTQRLTVECPQCGLAAVI